MQKQWQIDDKFKNKLEFGLNKLTWIEWEKEGDVKIIANSDLIMKKLQSGTFIRIQ